MSHKNPTFFPFITCTPLNESSLSMLCPLCVWFERRKRALVTTLTKHYLDMMCNVRTTTDKTIRQTYSLRCEEKLSSKGKLSLFSALSSAFCGCVSANEAYRYAFNGKDLFIKFFFCCLLFVVSHNEIFASEMNEFLSLFMLDRKRNNGKSIRTFDIVQNKMKRKQTNKYTKQEGKTRITYKRIVEWRSSSVWQHSLVKLFWSAVNGSCNGIQYPNFTTNEWIWTPKCLGHGKHNDNHRPKGKHAYARTGEKNFVSTFCSRPCFVFVSLLGDIIVALTDTSFIMIWLLCAPIIVYRLHSTAICCHPTLPAIVSIIIDMPSDMRKMLGPLRIRSESYWCH